MIHTLHTYNYTQLLMPKTLYHITSSVILCTNILYLSTRRPARHSEGVAYGSFRLNSSTSAVSEIASRRWWCIKSLFPNIVCVCLRNSGASLRILLLRLNFLPWFFIFCIVTLCGPVIHFTGAHGFVIEAFGTRFGEQKQHRILLLHCGAVCTASSASASQAAGTEDRL